MEKINIRRWKNAQKEERKFHLSRGIKKVKGVKKWNKYKILLNRYNKIDENTIFLDVGCGRDGMIKYIYKGERVGLDPLMNCFIKNFKLDKSINWIKGIGEYLPFKKNSIDIILCINVLDHMKNPLKAIKDIRKTLKNGGIFMLSITCYSQLLKLYRKIKEKINIGDVCHPFSFSFNDIENALRQYDLKIIYIHIFQKKFSNEMFFNLKKKNLKVALSLIIPFILSSLWKKINNIEQPTDNDDADFTFISRARSIRSR